MTMESLVRLAIVKADDPLAAAYVAHNQIAASELPTLHGALCGLGLGTTPESRSELVVVDKPTSAQIRKSIRPEYLVSCLDGRSYKMLKRQI